VGQKYSVAIAPINGAEPTSIPLTWASASGKRPLGQRKRHRQTALDPQRIGAILTRWHRVAPAKTRDQ